MLKGLGINLQNENIQEGNQESFTLVYNGKQCKCNIIANEFIPDIEGKLYVLGYLFDGLENHTIKIYLT